MKPLIAVCLLLLVTQSSANLLPSGGKIQQRKGDDLKPTQQSLDLNHLPLNTVAEVGGDITLSCGVADPDTPHTLQWFEFAHDGTGQLISDNEFILGHPEAARYSIITTTRGHYDLRISDVNFMDGGMYLCVDTQTSASNKRQHSASLTVLSTEINCTTTIKENGIVLDKSYQSHDCVLDYRGVIIPNITWAGPGPFNQAYVSTDNSVWCGMHFNVSRTMDSEAHQAITYFTDDFLPVDANTADNIPTYTRVYQGRQMFVYWGPTNTRAGPIKPQYEPGDILTCVTDSFPDSTYNWANMRTLEVIPGPTVRIEEAWRGFNQTMRCEARNDIEGTTYAENLFIPVDVPPLTTPTTTTPAPTTTPPPAVSDCGDLTGAWLSTNPTQASLCVRLNLESQGLLTGLMLNHTDTYWIDIVGRAQSNRFDQVGFNGIWPAHIGVSSFVGECHRCFGEEQLLVNVISRSVGDTCGVQGPTRYTSQYLFTRTTAIKCPNLPTVI